MAYSSNPQRWKGCIGVPIRSRQLGLECEAVLQKAWEYGSLVEHVFTCTGPAACNADPRTWESETGELP